MQVDIYVRLLGEGTIVYRPVPAVKISDRFYKLNGNDIYDPDDEDWEFLPESVVRVEAQKLEEAEVLVAVEKITPDSL